MPPGFFPTAIFLTVRRPVPYYKHAVPAWSAARARRAAITGLYGSGNIACAEIKVSSGVVKSQVLSCHWNPKVLAARAMCLETHCKHARWRPGQGSFETDVATPVPKILAAIPYVLKSPRRSCSSRKCAATTYRLRNPILAFRDCRQATVGAFARRDGGKPLKKIKPRAWSCAQRMKAPSNIVPWPI